MKKLLGSAAALALMTGVAQAAPIINKTSDAATLAGSILGAGITIVNATYEGSVDAAGAFTNGASVGSREFFDTGIVLTTGDADFAGESNTTTSAGFANGSTAFSSELASLITQSTNDVAILTIDFFSDSTDVFFNFLFASEEYNEFTNSGFNDVFGLFLNGVNIAVLPGSTTPVSINNVNGGNPFGDNATNPGFFNNNDIDSGGPFFDIQYDGFTDRFTATGAVNPGLNTLVFAIADAGDAALDSAVFIEGGTLSSAPPTEISEPGFFGLFGLALLGLGAATRRRR